MAAGFNSGINCTRCGACLQLCPVYDITRHEMFSPRGKARLFSDIIPGAVDESSFLKDVKVLETLSACLQCGACGSVCPAGVEVDEIVRGVRRCIRQLNRPGQMLLRGLLKNPGLLSRFARVFPRLPVESGLILRFLGIMGGWSFDDASMPVLPEIVSNPAVSRGFGGIRGGGRGFAEGLRIAFFVGCIQNYIYPEVAEAIARCLNGAFTMPAAQVCCGMPTFAAGLEDQARALALLNIRALEDAGRFDVVVTGCASCAAMIRRWPCLFEDGPDKDAAMMVASKVREFGEFFVESGAASGLAGAYAGLVMTYHAPCHQRFAAGGSVRTYGAEEIEGFLRCMDAGYFISTPRGCCGHGGVFSLRHAGLSKDIFKKRLEVMENNDVDVVLTTCSGCLLQFRMNLPEQKDLKALHIAEVLSGAEL